MKRIVVVLMFFVLLACETEITDQFLEDASHKMVLVGELVVNEPLMLNLTKALSMLEVDTVLSLSDADIKLICEDESYNLHHTEKGYYELDDYHIEGGKEYTIIASCDGYDDLEVNIRVPETPEVVIDFFVNDTFLMDFSAKISDVAQFADSYSFRISGWQRQICHEWINDTVETIDTSNISRDYYLVYYDSVPEYTLSWNGVSFRQINDYYSGEWMFFSDKSFNGTNYDLQLWLSLKSLYNDSIPLITVYLESFDSDFYSFIQSNASYYYRANGNDFIDTDIPLSQPIQVYSNVDGGFGLVRAKAVYSETIDLSEWYYDPEFLEIVN